jgi:Xaa-Pro aminopeptidase
VALMASADHSDLKTTQTYIDLAGETFREEAEVLPGEGAVGIENTYVVTKGGVECVTLAPEGLVEV